MSGHDRLSRQSLDGSIIRSSHRQPEVSQLDQQQEDGLFYRRPLSHRSTNPNVFSDDFSLEPLGPEEDHGLHRRASVSTASSFAMHSNTPPSPINNPEAPSNPFGDNSRSSLDEILPYRSSVQKDADTLNRHSSVTTTSSSGALAAQRGLSTPRAMSLYGGATAPSHPYAMYPQIGIGRSGSVTTTSTVRPADAPLQGPRAPQHPYAMYPQNIALEDGVGDNSIPVGFPGHNSSYQGESARPDDVGDIVGPDGHLEQLPPYSRYPVGMGPKDDARTASLVSLRRDQDLQENEERTAPSISSSNTLVDANSVTRLTSGTAVTTASLEEKLKKKSKQKVCCGVPVWLLVLTGIVMLLGACLGAVIGGVLGRKAEQTAKSTGNSTREQKVVTVTYTSDASPMTATPPSMPPLSTGQFRVPGTIWNQSRHCVATPSQTSSWACLNQGFVQIDRGHLNVTASFNPPSINTSFTYGAQAPFMTSPTQPLRFMIDNNNVDLGPALYFDAEFDKLVIVHEQDFSPMKRGFHNDFSPGGWNRKLATPGDKPWFCWWNSTYMEFFLYINQTCRDGGPPSASPFPPDSTNTMAGNVARAPQQAPPESPYQQPPPPPPPSNYPMRIKIEEKRTIPGAPTPYCVQMTVNKNNGFDASQMTVPIIELPPPMATVPAAKRDTPGGLMLAARDSYDETSCSCGMLSS